jgi:hypothetical protein
MCDANFYVRRGLLASAAIFALLIDNSTSVAWADETARKSIPIMPQVINVEKRVKSELEKGNLTDGQAKVFNAELARLSRVLSAGDKDAGHKVGLPSIGPTVGRDLKALEKKIDLAVAASQKKTQAK